ncbi:MAG TPA: VCBS repeat-containing protein, partial [Chitinophagales bacterium]|nr:VCBS repeat-containing protein [Chitinophagales bacterium]
DIDVLSASTEDDKIAWYENDGSGNFGTQQIITTVANGAISVYATDLDNDGDIDVLSASWGDNKIAWYENDGNGNFGTQQIITTTAVVAFSVYAADLDNDGDIDVLSASQNDNKIAWYENDGSGNFGAQQVITTTADGAYSVYTADLDNDGDMDVVSASVGDNKIAWYENDGSGNFGVQQVITTNADGANSVYAADLDNDGDIDVLSASILDDKIAWYENLLNNPHLSGTIFYDTNQNGTMDNGEFGLSNQNITLTPNPAYSYANNNGEFGFYSETAGTYTLSYNVPNGWTATTPTTQIITIGDGEFSTNNNFGIYPATFFTDVQPYITSGINRCNWTVPYYLTVINEGTTISPVSVVSLNPDERLTYVNANPAPDSIDTQGNLYWHIYNLLPAQQQQYIIDFQMPDFSAMGDTLSTVAAVYTY